MWTRSLPTSFGDERLVRLRPDPLTRLAPLPDWWAKRSARLAPRAVVPGRSPRTPRRLRSISAKKLSEGVLVRAISLAAFGERAVSTGGSERSFFEVPLTRRVPLTLTPARLSAARNARPALRSGWEA